jgi:nicotinate-nucleotide--dimethylbenzimidazole phosphoribosyltransferase
VTAPNPPRDLAELATSVSYPDHEAATRAHDALLTRGDLGRLARLLEWLAGTRAHYPIHDIARPRLVLVVADHRIADQGVSRLSPATTNQAVTAIESGAAPLAELAAFAHTGIALERMADATTASAAIEQGAALADREIDAGADLLIVGNLGAGSTTIAAAAISALTATEPVKVIGRGGRPIDDLAWMHKVAAVRDARRIAWAHRDDVTDLLASIDGIDIALLSGLLLRASARQTPVLLDGVVAAAAALIANTASAYASRWWQAAQLTGEPAQAVALRDLRLDPIVDFTMAAGDGTGGLVALGVLRAALALDRSAASAASADV